MEDLKWFVGFLIFFVVAWFITGGVSRDVVSPFIQSPIQTNESRTSTRTTSPSRTGELQTDLRVLEVQKGTSALEGALSLSRGSYSATVPVEEYVEVRLSDSAPARVLLSGMTLKSSASGRVTEIGRGAYLPQQASINAEEPIYLEPGGVAYIITGRSPTGYSFRLNTCTGYFGQSQRWTPSLPHDCPLPRTEPLPLPPNHLPDSCLEFIDSTRRCRIEPAPPDTLSPQCRNFIRESFTYPRCVSAHKSDAGFYKNEWRIYLSRDNTLWKSTREIISLIDQSGKTIDTITY